MCTDDSETVQQEANMFGSVSGHPAKSCKRVTLLDFAALPTHHLFTPADIYSFRHGDLHPLTQRVESKSYAFYILLCSLMFCCCEADEYTKCPPPSARLSAMEIDKCDLCLTFPALIPLYFYFIV